MVLGWPGCLEKLFSVLKPFFFFFFFFNPQLFSRLLHVGRHWPQLFCSVTELSLTNTEMAISKKKKPETPDKDIELLKSDVASFASSIGLASASSSLTNNSGFDDSDFRKTGTLKKPQDPSKLPPSKPKLPTEEKNPKPQKEKNPRFQKKREYQPIKKNENFPSVEVGPKPQLKNLPKLPLMRASSLGVWYEDVAELEKKVIGKEARIGVKNGEEWNSLVEKKKEFGERLLAQFAQDFDHSRGKTGDIKMLMTTQRSGTAADKVSAFAVLIGENPIANIRSLDALLAMVTSKVGKRHALTGFEALKELFLSSLLPDRKLKSMFQRLLNHLPESRDGYTLLLFWYWEECLKQRYERFVLALEEASRDMLPILKDKALKSMYALLTSKSEQERKLLSALVNKLGDPENKGASNADYYLTNLLSVHPNMKAVVIDEVDSFLFRPRLGLRAKYHAVNFLSQIRLCHKGDGHKIAKRLVDVYFALFKVFISDVGDGKKMDKNKGDDKKFVSSHQNSKDVTPLESNAEMDSRLLSALLTGINRAFPFVTNDESDDVVEVQTPILFKLVHSKNFNIGVQALMLLDKIASKNQVVSDRFYRALYSKLLLPAAMNSSKAEMFIGLLLRAMKNDVNLKRVSAFSKRLLQIALQQPPQFACGSLFLLSEVLKARPPLWNMVLQNELIDEDIEHFEDIVEDPVGGHGTMPSEPLENSDGISCNTNADVKNDSDSSSDSEVKAGPLSDTDDDSDVDLLKGDSFKDVGGVITATDVGNDQSRTPNAQSLLPGGYDPRHREPSYCNADRASWWELMVLASHVHPSVATMARTLLSGANIVYNGNPLKDLSLSAFLDKFMEKKPKQIAWHGGSQIEPAKKLDMSNHLIGAEILALTEVDVPPEDLVFHKFYMNKMTSSMKTKKKKKKKKKKGPEDEVAEDLLGVDGRNESDEEIGGDDSDDDEIDNMLDSGDKTLEADGGYDYNDLDKLANEDDDDLIGYDSDPETELPADIAEGEEDSDDDVPVDIGDVDDTDGDDDDVPVDMSDAYDIDDDDKICSSNKRKRNKKSGGKSGVSPFASLDEYSHLLNEDAKTKPKDTKTKPKPRKKKKRDI